LGTVDARRGLSPYQALLGHAYDTLHEHVRLAHEAPLDAHGDFDVVHGTHPLTRALVALMKLPAAGAGVPVSLTVISMPPHATGAPLAFHWRRRFGRHALSTRQYARHGFLVEHMGPGRLAFSLRAADGCLLYESASLQLLRVRVPLALSPRVRARVAPDPHGWRVEVFVEWRGHLICRYWGTMRPLPAPS
jgi:hypothetical protein